MGAVYLGEDPFIGRRVAIKVMRPQVEEGAERFLQEARTIGSLSHPNIVLLHDFGFAGELPYLVMEHVDGTILDKWLAEPRDARERLRVLAGLCRAVTYAHSRGVLHRDLKPSNVLVRSDGEAKLLDFGIARVENTRMTATGVVLGTPEYLAPELLGSGKFSPRSDMYALGLVAYELFGGRNPFGADTVAACLRRVLEVEPVPLAADSSAPAGSRRRGHALPGEGSAAPSGEPRAPARGDRGGRAGRAGRAGARRRPRTGARAGDRDFADDPDGDRHDRRRTERTDAAARMGRRRSPGRRRSRRAYRFFATAPCAAPGVATESARNGGPAEPARRATTGRRSRSRPLRSSAPIR